MKKEIEPMPSEQALAEVSVAWQLSSLTFVRKMENIVYRATKDGNEVFVRFSSPLRRKKSDILTELHWIFYLRDCNLPVPNLVKDNDGAMSRTVADQGQSFEVCVFEKMHGVHPTKVQVQDSGFLRKLGSLLATVHNVTEHYQPLSDCHREEWHHERGFRHAETAIKVTTNELMKSKFVRAREWLQQLPKSQRNYGLIHGDWGSQNLFVDSHQNIYVIDFDDSCYHWHVFDLAIAIYALTLQNDEHPHVEHEMLRWVDNLVEGYRLVRLLDDEEVNQIPMMIDFAYVRLYFWIEDHQRLDTFSDNVKPNVEKLKVWLEKKLASSSRL